MISPAVYTSWCLRHFGFSTLSPQGETKSQTPGLTFTGWEPGQAPTSVERERDTACRILRAQSKNSINMGC